MEALQRLHNRGSIPTGYDIDNSLKVEADNSESLTRSAQDGGDRRIVTISFWTKRTELTSSYEMLLLAGVNGSKYSALGFQTTNTLNFHYYNGGSYPYQLTTNRVFRDTSAWYHIVIAMDTTQGTAANRIKMYINGVQETSFSVEAYPTQNIDTPFNNDSQTYPIEIGNQSVFGIGGIAYSGYLSDYYLVDGSQLEPTEFGEFDDDTGIWKPKAYTGSYGTNGFYLDFADSGDLGDDESGNGNDFTEVNITAADQATDTPTNNFATWNILDITRTNNQGVDMVEGATNIKHRSANGWTGTCSNIAVSKGKWYWEAEVRVTNGGSMWGAYPVATRQANVFFNSYIGASEGSGYDSGAAFYDNDDAYYHDNTATNCTIGGSTFNTVTGDVIMIAVDMDNNKIYAGVNGNWCNSSDDTLPNATGITLSDEPHFLAAATYAANTTNSYNFGGFTTDTISSPATDANGYGTFEYAPPSGYYALCTKNLEEFG